MTTSEQLPLEPQLAVPAADDRSLLIDADNNIESCNSHQFGKGTILCVVALITMHMLPLFMELGSFDKKGLTAFNTVNGILTVACSLAVCIPMLADIVLDLLYIPQANRGFLFHRLVLLGSLCLYNIIYLSTINNNNFLLYEQVFGFLQITLELFASLLLLLRMDSRAVWNQWNIFGLMFVYMTGILFVYIGSIPGYTVYAIVFAVCSTLFVASTIGFMIRWLYLLYLERKTTTTPMSFDDQCSVIIIICFIANALVILGSYLALENNVTESYVVMGNLLRTLYATIVTFVPGRMLRHASIEQVYHLQNANILLEKNRLEDMLRLKRTFVRYVSHEIR